MFGSKDNARELPPKEKPFSVVESRKMTGETQIAQGATVKGDLRTPGAAIIEGTIEGTVSASGDVQVGIKGNVHAEIEGCNITVAGTVKGKIYADDKVTLLSGAHVEGDIHAQSLKIEDSVFFQGGCVMGEGARKRKANDGPPLPETVKQLKAA